MRTDYVSITSSPTGASSRMMLSTDSLGRKHLDMSLGCEPVVALLQPPGVVDHGSTYM